MTLHHGLVTDPAEWRSILERLPNSHLLQSWEWGEFKQGYGWLPERIVWREASEAPIAAAQVLVRTVRTPLPGLTARVLYVPRGPVLDWRSPAVAGLVLSDLRGLAGLSGVIQLKIDPDLPVGYGPQEGAGSLADVVGEATRSMLKSKGWRPSPEQVQFRNTFVLDLRPTEEELLGAMKQKTRYNVRLAQKHGVTVRPGTLEDLDLLYRLYAETSVRDQFVIRSPEYYRDVWGRFMRAGLAQPLIAECEDEAVAALIIYRLGPRAWYLYGMSRELYRERMPNYLLQWEAIRWAKAAGCLEYDLWGAPDRLDPQDRMWGVYRFKEGLGGRLVRTLGAWDATDRPLGYRLYHSLLPLLLAVMRRRGRQSTLQSLD